MGHRYFCRSRTAIMLDLREQKSFSLDDSTLSTNDFSRRKSWANPVLFVFGWEQSLLVRQYLVGPLGSCDKNLSLQYCFRLLLLMKKRTCQRLLALSIVPTSVA